MPKVKLTDADVRGLCYARNVEGAPLRWLAENYGVSMAQVSRVTRGLQRRDKKMDWEWGPMPAAPVSSHEETPEVGKWSDETYSYKFTTKTLDLTDGETYKYVTIDRPAVDGESEEAFEYFYKKL